MNVNPAAARTMAPTPLVPGTAAALPVGETALRQVLAAHGADPASSAQDLLRSVEALLRSTAPHGLSVEDLGAAAARLVERQGLLARLAAAQPAGKWPAVQATEDLEPPAVDTLL
jgi:hypothetical protein